MVHRSVGRPAFLVRALILSGACWVGGRWISIGFCPPAKLAEAEVSFETQELSRRQLLASLGALSSAPIVASLPVGAEEEDEEEEKKPEKKAAEPEELELSGHEGIPRDVNGRWTKLSTPKRFKQWNPESGQAFRPVRGKRINGKAIYTKGNYYLLYGNCDLFVISANKVDGDCKTAVGVKTKDGWTFDGKLDPNAKLRPIK
eukprot:TRINITY_DN42577_c0_g1_i1.p1 TRINITY_DN42577_c0_g1~~TRINITY_DN42577_c0_g1_i1.p1  ORF type:complete len:202 (+),score=43.57 TRINITY_DN42577_c0_g1_i1:67-672(+)